jgi:sigma-B regulation protein RsbU (phosphoserine phosphatase)
MAMTKSAFRTELKHLGGNAILPNVLQSLNQTVLENATRRMFVSFECAIFDFAARTVTVANAGHGMVACVRNGVVRILQPKGTALGLAQKGIFSEERCDLRPDDIFLFFTDGIVEATGKHNEEFGTDRIFSAVQAVLREKEQMPSPEMVYDAVLHAAQIFTGTSAFADDATLVVLRVV